ncbi:hypothetical protein D9M69_588930 [compost metagenome]
MLRSPDGGGRQVLVHARLEYHVVGLQVLLGLPQRLVQPPQRRSAVARNVAAGVQAGLKVARFLHQGQAHQGLRAAQVDAPLGAGVFVVQRQAMGIGRAGGK